VIRFGFVFYFVHRSFKRDGAIDRGLANKPQKAKGQYSRQDADQHATREKGSDHLIDLLLRELRREWRRNFQIPDTGRLKAFDGQTGF